MKRFCMQFLWCVFLLVVAFGPTLLFGVSDIIGVMFILMCPVIFAIGVFAAFYDDVFPDTESSSA